jgi:hypothetical protein
MRELLDYLLDAVCVCVCVYTRRQYRDYVVVVVALLRISSSV